VISRVKVGEEVVVGVSRRVMLFNHDGVAFESDIPFMRR
jgi:hypothetical protein